MIHIFQCFGDILNICLAREIRNWRENYSARAYKSDASGESPSNSSGRRRYRILCALYLRYFSQIRNKKHGKNRPDRSGIFSAIKKRTRNRWFVEANPAERLPPKGHIAGIRSGNESVALETRASAEESIRRRQRMIYAGALVTNLLIIYGVAKLRNATGIL